MTIPFPWITCHSFSGLTLDTNGSRLLTVASAGELPHVVFYILEFGTGDGALVSNYTVSANFFQPISLSPTNVSGSLYVSDGANASITFFQPDAAPVTTTAGPHPLLSEPTAVATLDGQRLYVGTNSPSGFIALDAAGQWLGTVVEDAQNCNSAPFQSLAVATDGSVLVPDCNGGVNIYTAVLDWQRTVHLGDGVQPRSLATGQGLATVWAVDNNNATVVSQYDLKNGSVLSTLQGGSKSVFYGLDVDRQDGSVWAADIGNSSIYHWDAAGSLLSVWGQTQPPVNLALDATNQRLLVTVPAPGTLLWLELHSDAVVQSFAFPAGQAATGVAVTQDGQTVFATNFEAMTVYVFQQDKGIELGRGVKSSAWKPVIAR